MIDGRLYDNLVARTGKGIHGEAYTFYDAWDEVHPLCLHAPLVVGFYPLANHVPIVLWQDTVATDGMLQPLCDSIADKRRCFEIHVGHPEGQQIVATEIVDEKFVLDVVSTTTVNDFVKIVDQGFQF